MSVDGGVQSITLIHGPSSLLPRVAATATLPLFRFSLRISVVLSHHLSLADRRTDGRLSRVRNAPFLFFTSGVPGDEIQVFVCFPSSPPLPLSPPRPCQNKTAATKRIDASRCKFVLFFTTGHPATAFASPYLVVPANKGFLLQRRRSELDRPSSTLYKLYRILLSARFFTIAKIWRRYSFVSSLAS